MISTNDVQLSNTTSARDEHQANAEESIKFTLGGITICCNDLHILKDLLPIFLTEGGITNSLNLMHSSKALDSNKAKEDGVSIVTCSNDEQK